ncbi:MAG TPA: transcriptional regulator PpsR, partial [Burkholderiaceae bacterium]|nr:transcriptional regulator PpsR [Burkholderiaceae bacterium]
MREFESPAFALADLSAELMGKLLALSADVRFIVDDECVIREIADVGDSLLRESLGRCLGRRWGDVVGAGGRPKVEALLREARDGATPPWRCIEHLALDGTALPLSCSVIALPPPDDSDTGAPRSMVLARDLRSNALLQQRLVSAQQAMEQDYRRMRQMETRYRMLFEASAEAVLVLDAPSGRIEEANAAASALLGADAVRVGAVLTECFMSDPNAEQGTGLAAMFSRVQATGQSEVLVAHRSAHADEFQVSASFLRAGRLAQLLVRISPPEGAGRSVQGGAHGAVAPLIEGAPDAFVVTDVDGLILSANRAFIDLTESASEAQVRHRSLERWLGRTGVDLNVLINNLRQRGAVRLFATVVRGEHGSISEVEISGVALAHAQRPILGFTIRDVSRRLAGETRASGAAAETSRALA